jgi:outer membrane protein
MNKLIYCSLTLVLLMLLSTTNTLFAQQRMKLSLDEARSYALEHNRRLIGANHAIDQSQLALRETIRQGLPQVNASVDYSNFFGSKATLGNFPGFEIEFNPTSNLSISVGQLIFSGSYIVGIQTAKLFKEITETNREKTELEVLTQVSQAYYLALITKKSREIVAANQENMSDLLEKTKALVQVGIAEEIDYDQLSIQAVMLENALRASDRQHELSLNMLRLQMGLPADADIVLSDDIEVVLAKADFHQSLATQFSIDNNLDYKLLSLQTNIAGRQIDLEKAAYLPSLTGFYNYTEKLLKPEFDITPKHVIGLNMNIPIFSSGVRKSRVNKARVNLKMAENDKEMVMEQLLLQEKQLRFNLSNALEQYQSQQANLNVAKRVFNNINDKYRQGMVSSLDLVTANSNYLQVENAYISALMQLLDAQLELEKLLNL